MVFNAIKNKAAMFGNPKLNHLIYSLGLWEACYIYLFLVQFCIISSLLKSFVLLINFSFLIFWLIWATKMHPYRSNHPGVFLETGVLKIYSKITGEYLCQSAISIKLLCNFIEIILRHGCSPVKMMHIFRTPFLKNAFS